MLAMSISGDVAGLGALLAILSTFFLFFAIIGLVMYILNGIALMKISDNEGFDKGWFAWIPILNMFVMPMLVEDDVHESVAGKFTMIFGISLGASILLGAFIPFVALVPAIMTYYAFYIIADWYSENAVVHLVIGILTFGFSIPISLFRFRNRENLYE